MLNTLGLLLAWAIRVHTLLQCIQQPGTHSPLHWATITLHFKQWNESLWQCLISIQTCLQTWEDGRQGPILPKLILGADTARQTVFSGWNRETAIYHLIPMHNWACVWRTPDKSWERTSLVNIGLHHGAPITIWSWQRRLTPSMFVHQNRKNTFPQFLVVNFSSSCIRVRPQTITHCSGHPSPSGPLLSCSMSCTVSLIKLRATLLFVCALLILSVFGQEPGKTSPDG